MAVFLVAYDLVKETNSDGYEILNAKLEAMGGHRSQYSLWLVSWNGTAQALCADLEGSIDSNDRLWVTRLNSGQHWYKNAMSGTNDWLSRNPL